MRTRPTPADTAHADDLFRARLVNPIDLRHPLAKLAERMPWTALEEALAPIRPVPVVRLYRYGSWPACCI